MKQGINKNGVRMERFNALDQQIRAMDWGGFEWDDPKDYTAKEIKALLMVQCTMIAASKEVLKLMLCELSEKLIHKFYKNDEKLITRLEKEGADYLIKLLLPKGVSAASFFALASDKSDSEDDLDGGANFANDDDDLEEKKALAFQTMAAAAKSWEWMAGLHYGQLSLEEERELYLLVKRSLLWIDTLSLKYAAKQKNEAALKAKIGKVGKAARQTMQHARD